MADLEKRLRILEGIVNGLRSRNRTTQRLSFIATAGLISTAWDGDAYSTTAKTLIDLSVVFGLPTGIKAIAVRLIARDSGSAGSSTLFLALWPNNDTAVFSAIHCRPSGLPNDYWMDVNGICPCDENGDVWYEISASGAGTLDAYIRIWGYWI